VLVLACSRERAKDPQPAQQAPEVTKPPGPVIILATAAFRDDRLAECDELFVRPPKPLGVDAGAKVAEIADAIWNARKELKGVTMTRLNRACDEQFADRKPFGACFDMPMFKDRPELRGNVRHYSFDAVFKSDGMMRECMQEGGNWKAMSKDSPEYIGAKLENDSDKAQKNYDDARKDVDRAMRALK
jgi:hypothetical protein